MPKSHHNYNIMIQLLIDKELTSKERDDLNTHLKDCAICQQQLEDVKAFTAAVRRAKPRIETPPDLRERVLTYMTAYRLKHTESEQMESGEAVHLPCD
ncbi:hypothetical protein [Granulicella sp. dw_53]|uniref:anti-sigma factor family protein n=1 Tax=Granulicella sp. dw_53 TaxID=2719792 RepID=UPI001BD5F269|nr:hypothetical protein [Granulicella sp. dw_53]